MLQRAMLAQIISIVTATARQAELLATMVKNEEVKRGLADAIKVLRGAVIHMEKAKEKWRMDD